jgi:hypothetical protein
MPTTSMVVTAQTIEVDGITDIGVGAIFHDDVVGDYYREIVFFGTPPDLPVGTTTVDVGTIPEVLRIKIRAITVEPLHVSVPESEF